MIVQGCVISCGTVVFFQKSRNLTRSLLTNSNFYCACMLESPSDVRCALYCCRSLRARRVHVFCVRKTRAASTKLSSFSINLKTVSLKANISSLVKLLIFCTVIIKQDLKLFSLHGPCPSQAFKNSLTGHLSA